MNNWIYCSDITPDYYRNVNIILMDGTIINDFHLLSDIDYQYFGSLNTNDIYYWNEVAQWVYTI